MFFLCSRSYKDNSIFIYDVRELYASKDEYLAYKNAKAGNLENMNLYLKNYPTGYYVKDIEIVKKGNQNVFYNVPLQYKPEEKPLNNGFVTHFDGTQQDKGITIVNGLAALLVLGNVAKHEISEGGIVSNATGSDNDENLSNETTTNVRRSLSIVEFTLDKANYCNGVCDRYKITFNQEVERPSEWELNKNQIFVYKMHSDNCWYSSSSNIMNTSLISCDKDKVIKWAIDKYSK